MSDAIGQLRDAGFLGHRAIEQPHDRRQDGVLPDVLNAHHERACDVDCSADQRIADSFQHRPALAGQQRLVDSARAFDDATVGRNR